MNCEVVSLRHLAQSPGANRRFSRIALSSVPFVGTPRAKNDAEHCNCCDGEHDETPASQRGDSNSGKKLRNNDGKAPAPLNSGGSLRASLMVRKSKLFRHHENLRLSADFVRFSAYVVRLRRKVPPLPVPGESVSRPSQTRSVCSVPLTSLTWLSTVCCQ